MCISWRTFLTCKKSYTKISQSTVSPTPVGVGTGTSLIWAVHQIFPPGESLAMRDYRFTMGMAVKLAHLIFTTWPSGEN